MDDLAILVQQIKHVSSLPTVFIKVNELINDPRSSASDLGQVIEKDQSLTSRLLRLANSAFYGFPGRIDSVSRAITIIGFKQLRDLVLATSVRSLFSGFGKDSVIDMHTFWEHSIASAITCRILAVYKGDRAPESHFVAGFLHDFGRLILLEHYPQKCQEVYRIAKDERRLVYEVETEMFGFSHAEVGAELIKSWRLPDSLVEAIACHHHPEKASAASELADLVHLANVFTHACWFGFSGDHFVPPLSKAAWQRSGLKVSMLEPALHKIREQVDDLMDLVGGS